MPECLHPIAALSWQPVLDVLASGGVGLAHVLIWALCLVGLLLSALSISGTWLVVAASLLAAWISPDPFPGFWFIAICIVVSTAVEVLESVAGHWGVVRRGGSGWAGLAALAGGLVGLVVGSALLPVVGSLLGMLAGSFALAYVVERRRLRHDGQALHIATGAVLARLAMILVKGLATAAMAVILLVGFY